jgi:hypothetical protein
MQQPFRAIGACWDAGSASAVAVRHRHIGEMQQVMLARIDEVSALDIEYLKLPSARDRVQGRHAALGRCKGPVTMSAVRDTVPSAMKRNGNMVLGDPQLLLLNPDPMVPRPRKAPRPWRQLPLPRRRRRRCRRCHRRGLLQRQHGARARPFRPPRSPIARPPGPASSSTTRRSPASRSGCT